MSNYQGIHFTVRARSEDKPRTTQLLTSEYPECDVSFITADCEVPEIESVKVPDGHWIAGFASRTDDVPWNNDGAAMFRINAAEFLLRAFLNPDSLSPGS